MGSNVVAKRIGTKKKPGPKPAIDEKREAEILAALSIGGSQLDAAGYCGIDPKTIANHRRANPGFSARVEKAIYTGKLKLIKKVAQATAWQAAAWMLERRWGSEFGRRAAFDLTSGGDKIQGGFDPKLLSREQLEALIALLENGKPVDSVETSAANPA